MKAERDKAADMGGLRLVPKSVRQAAEQLVDGSGGSKVCWGDVWSVKCGAASSHVRTHCIGIQDKSHWTRNNTRTSGFFLHILLRTWSCFSILSGAPPLNAPQAMSVEAAIAELFRDDEDEGEGGGMSVVGPGARGVRRAAAGRGRGGGAGRGRGRGR